MPIAAVQDPEKTSQVVGRITGGVALDPVLVDFRQDPNLNRAPDYLIYIFSIARKAFIIHRPPQFAVITFAACPKNREYIKVAVIPNVVNYRWIDSASGETRTLGEAGERVATDFLNPNNLGVDIWAQADEQINWIDGGSDDLTRRGLFWSRNEQPFPIELERCRARMENHYKLLIAQADDLVQNGERKSLTPEHHLAAEYFKIKTAWHSIAELQRNCPNCGEQIGDGIAFHRNSMGMICVIDWKRAIEAGVKTREDVPENLRWWGPEPPRPATVREAAAQMHQRP